MLRTEMTQAIYIVAMTKNSMVARTRWNRAPSRCIVALALLAAHISAAAWFGPSEKEPYRLHPQDTATASKAPWVWADKRPSGTRQQNEATQDGYALGDNVFFPRPWDYVQSEFFQQVLVHEEKESLLEKLAGKTIELWICEVDVGLWLRLSQRQSGRWEMVRVRLSVRIDGQTFETVETLPFKSGATPSPAAEPMREAVKGLVEQVHQFY